MVTEPQASWCIGAMSGTSLDGVDLALVRTDGTRVLELGPALSEPYSDADQNLIRAAVDEAVRLGKRQETESIKQAARALTARHIEAVTRLLAEFGTGEPIAHIGFHGQTVYHRPEAGLTWQIGEPEWLAQETGLDVVWDLRVADVVAGGEGAPLAPLYHAALAEWSGSGPLAVLNLGGVGNITWLGSGTVLTDNAWDLIQAFDTGPANGLIDDWVRAHDAGRFDTGGAIAAKGRVHDSVLGTLTDNPWFDQPPPKSLDRRDFELNAARGLSLEDGAATLTAFTAETVRLALAHMPRAVSAIAVTGGGRHNPTLMGEIAVRTGISVKPVEEWGWRGDTLEAEAFGFLGMRSRLGLPITVPGTTGSPAPMTGGVLVAA